MNAAVKIYVPRDSAALAVGANAVAQRIAQEAAARGLAIELVRNGSRGMLWLEPLVEVETPAGRMAYGPVTVEEVPALFDAGLGTGARSHPLSLGPTDEIPYLKKQERLTFARVGGNHHNRHLDPLFPQATGQLPAIHTRHVHIQKVQVRLPMGDQRQTLFRILGFRHNKADGLQNIVNQRAVGFIVIHHQYFFSCADITADGLFQCRCHRGFGNTGQHQRHRKTTAHPGLTLQ